MAMGVADNINVSAYEADRGLAMVVAAVVVGGDANDMNVSADEIDEGHPSPS